MADVYWFIGTIIFTVIIAIATSYWASISVILMWIYIILKWAFIFIMFAAALFYSVDFVLQRLNPKGK